MLTYRLLYLISLVTFSFGALTFSALMVLYLREKGARRKRAASVLPAFTAICAWSFLINLALQIASAGNAAGGWIAGLSLALGVATSLLPPCMFHLVYAQEARQLPAGFLWRWFLYLFYPASLALGFAKGLYDAGFFPAGSADWLNPAPAAALGLAAALALMAQVLSRRKIAPAERHQRWWTRLILACMAAFSAAYLARQPDLFVGLLPDYLVLALFCVTLYYEERLVFFDLLIKRGAMFAIALAGLTAISMAGLPMLEKSRLDWSAPWICALVLAPFWLAAPRIYRTLDRFIDRVWLHRRYSIADAEPRFAEDIREAAADAAAEEPTEENLRRDAALSLGEIFQACVEIDFGGGAAPHDGAMTADLEQDGLVLGRISVADRQDGVPFMSDDHRLLRSVARTLAAALQNLRLRRQRRQQEEREQALRLLASRAELKALRAQINPHFLFNALNAIAGLIEEDPRRADETIERLAQVFRYALRKPESEWVTLGEELAFVEAYLRVEQARFGQRLHVKLEVDPAAGAIPIPAVTVQPLVENAIRHGVSSLDGPWIVGLRAALDGDELCIEVSDNGPGFPRDYSIGAGGHGLRNVADRLAGYYRGSARLSWKCGLDGTRVRLEMPAAASVKNEWQRYES